MRYHIDPDQGTLWGYETAVVSIGATRRFAFRSTENDTTTDTQTPSSESNSNCKPHTFILMNGDVTEMFNDCQERFQHTVKTAENKEERAPRVSLVFKKTLTPSKSSIR
jgi:alkylated DNA repair dioxygenase AlkB